MDIKYLLLFLMRLDAFVCSLFTCVLFLCLSSSFCSGVRRYVLLTYYTCFNQLGEELLHASLSQKITLILNYSL